MKTTAVLTALMMTVALATQATAADSTTPKHHGKAVGAAMVVGGVALMGLSAFVLSRPCPAEQRAAQIGQLIGQTVTAGSCGSSFMEKNKTAIGASGLGAGAALVVAGFAVSWHNSDRTALLVAPKTMTP